MMVTGPAPVSGYTKLAEVYFYIVTMCAFLSMVHGVFCSAIRTHRLKAFSAQASSQSESMDNPRTALTLYEQTQIGEILKWRAEVPSVMSKALGVALSPVTWLIGKVVPEAAIRGVLDFSSGAAEWMTDTNDITRDAGVASLGELRTLDLQTSDRLANAVHNWAIGLAGAEGGLTGAGGLIGLAVDIPAVIVMALRTIHKIGACYGFSIETKEDRDFVLAILAASGANDMEEKVAALLTLRTIEVALAKQSWKKLAQKAATEKLSREAGIITLKNLAKQLGVNLTKRKALQAIPAVGAIVGASVNGWYIKEVGWAARRAFQERWLIENEKVVDL